MMRFSMISDYLKVLPQYLLPHHLLSRWILKLTRLRGGFLSRWMIKLFIHIYQIDTQAVKKNIDDFKSFNQFFTRALHPAVRPIAQATLISPVDGHISQIGSIHGEQLIQAKNRWFRLQELLAGTNDKVTLFQQGLFCTLYLSPSDYHRIHMPITGQLTQMIYVPGRLFSVNTATTRIIPRLFARNERIICFFKTEIGTVAIILVGALLVGSMETVWAGVVTPNSWRHPQHWDYASQSIILKQGAELGRFNMGSTVIILVEPHQVTWSSACQIERQCLMGQCLAQKLR